MKFMSYGKDGGQDSTVWGFWLVEAKALFSVALLCFEDGSREAFHEHAFNSVSWVLHGQLHENTMGVNIDDTRMLEWHTLRDYLPSLKPIRTPRSQMHKVSSVGRSWVITFRGPWTKTWREWLPKERRFQTLASGRKVVA